MACLLLHEFQSISLPTCTTDVWQANKNWRDELDKSARPGTKTYPRWKDALLGCFKKGRYPHLYKKVHRRTGHQIYGLDMFKMPAKVLEVIEAEERRFVRADPAEILPPDDLAAAKAGLQEDDEYDDD